MRNGRKSSGKTLMLIAGTAVVALVLAVFWLFLWLNWPSGPPSAVKATSTRPAPFDANTREEVRDFVAEEVERQAGRSLHAFGTYASGLLAVVSLLIVVALAVLGFTWWRQTREYDRLMAEARSCRDEVGKHAGETAEMARKAREDFGAVQEVRDQAQEAVEEIRGLLEETKESARTTKSDRHFTQALTYQNQGILDRAVDEYTHSIEAEASAPAYSNRGVARLDKGEHHEAVEDFKRAIELDADADAFVNLGEALIVCGRYTEAKAQMDEAVRRGFMTAEEEQLTVPYLKALALALAGEPTTEEETALQGCISRGVKAPGWRIGAMERHLAGLKPADFQPGAVDTARRIHAKFKEAVV